MNTEERFQIRKITKSSKTLRFPDELILRMQAVADAKDISFNELAVQCCEFALKHIAEDNNKKVK